MKRRIIFTFFAIFITQITFAQADKSKSLLDEVSSKIANYKNIQISFDYNLNNPKANVNQKSTGNVNIMGDKYNLKFMGIERIFDGAKVYTVAHEDEEVVISNEGTSGEDFSPSKILSFYKKGYTYTWDKLTNIEGKDIQFIKLTPIKSGDISSILLGIDTQTKNIQSVEYNDKKNTKTTLKIRSFKTNVELPAKEFSFDEAKYKAKNYTITRM